MSVPAVGELKTITVIGGTREPGKDPGLGYWLAARWAKHGHDVLLGSRDTEKAARSAASLTEQMPHASIGGLANPEAAEAGDIVVVTVRPEGHARTMESIRPHVLGKTVVDCTVSLVPARERRVRDMPEVRLPEEGSAAERAQKILGTGVTVVSAFHHVAAELLASDAEMIDRDVMVCGDDGDAAARVIELVEAAGLNGFHAGPLYTSGHVENLTALLIGMGMFRGTRNLGINIVGLIPP